MPGEGSIFQRKKDGRWVAQLSLGPRTDRKYLRRTVKTRRAAVAALAELRIERAEGTQSTQSLGDYLRWWLEHTAAPTVTPNTLRGYRAAVEHFAPIHHVPLAKLRADQIEEACDAMRATRWMGKTKRFVDQGPASAKTVRNAQLMLRAALEQAQARGHVRRNEARLVRLRTVRRLRRPAMTPTMARSVLAAIAGDRLEAAYALAMAALRESELLGLTRADVDLETGVVTIRHQLRGSGRAARLAPTKTEASAETVDLPAFVVERLRAHMERLDPVALLFTTERGYAVNGSWFNKHFQALLRRADLPRMTVHELRAGASTLLAAAGAHPRIAQDFLRHAQVTTTLRDYTRTTPDQRRQAAELLDTIVRGPDAESHAESHANEPERGRTGPNTLENGSGGRTRTYDQAVNSRAAAILESAFGESPRESR